jgi:CMP-N,N'-diacetyllegionaminic acid synthase
LEIPQLREQSLATDLASSVDVALNALDIAEANGEQFELVALLQPTSPIRESHRWEHALLKIKSTSCDAVVGVSPVYNHPMQTFKFQAPADDLLIPWVDHEGLSLRSQDLPPSVFVNGSLYLIKVTALRREKTFFPKNTRAILFDTTCESMDIDTEDDWICSEAMANFYNKKI